MDASRAHELLRDVIHDLWRQGHRPILGSRLKADLIQRALKEGSEFDERKLGFTSFANFVTRSGVASVKVRAGQDMLVAPIEHSGELEATSNSDLRAYIRADFWRAFVTFPVPGQLRAYDPVSDQVLWQPPMSFPARAILTEPVSRETQLEWRKQFLASLDDVATRDALLAALSADGGFRQFALAIGGNPALRVKWNKVFVERVTEVIRKWGQGNGIPERVWLLSGRDEHPEDIRNRLYKVLDEIPIENLLEINIPLKWLVKKKSST